MPLFRRRRLPEPTHEDIGAYQQWAAAQREAGFKGPLPNAKAWLADSGQQRERVRREARAVAEAKAKEITARVAPKVAHRSGPEPPRAEKTRSRPQVTAAVVRGARQRSDPWPPSDVRKAAFDSDCDLCGEAILGGIDLMTHTGCYYWVHRKCVGLLGSYDDDSAPRVEAREWPEPPKIEYRCQGVTGAGELCPVKPQIRWIDDPEAVFYCGRHKRQRPEGSKDIPAERAYPEGWELQPRGLSVQRLAVVGESFCDGYPENLYRIREALIESDGQPEGPPVVLRRNPANTHDANAVEVHVPMIAGPIGHLDREAAAYYAPLLDEGQTFHAYVSAIGVHPDSPELPGAYLQLVRQR